jgi:hypothetical protein
LAAQTFCCIAGAAIAVSDEEGSSTFIGSAPDVLLEGIVNGEHVTPGGKLAGTGQVSMTGPANPPLGVRVIVEFPVAIVPAAAGEVATVGTVAVIVKLPPEVTVKVTGAELLALKLGSPL